MENLPSLHSIMQSTLSMLLLGSLEVCPPGIFKNYPPESESGSSFD